MKRERLEDILRKTGRFLATSIIASTFALPTFSQETQRIRIESNGSWNQTYNTTLYLRDQKNGGATIDPRKNKKDQSPAEVYFNGRLTKEGYLDFTYSTTDLNNPKQDSPHFDPAQSKLYLLAMPGVKKEDIKQMMAIQKANGEIVFRDLVQSKDANGFYIGIGRNLLKKLGENDPLSKLKGLTSGIVDISSTNILYFLNEAVDKTARESIRPENDYVEITEIPYWSLDRKDATMGTEVGRRVILKLNSQKPKEKISIHHSLRIKGGRNFEKDEGKFTACTEPFEIPVTQTYNTANLNSLAGIWIIDNTLEEGDDYTTQEDKDGPIVTITITGEDSIKLESEDKEEPLRLKRIKK